MGETGREDAGKPCWLSSFRGEPEETAELRDAPDKQERGGSSRGSEGAGRRGEDRDEADPQAMQDA